MKNLQIKTFAILLCVLIVASVLPVYARTPGREAEGLLGIDNSLADATGVRAVEPLYIASGAAPGFYVARDNYNLDKNTYGVVGGHQSFYWDTLNTAENVYNWDPIETFIVQELASGKKAAFGIITFNGRANEGWSHDPPVRVPSWVFAAGAGKVYAPGNPAKWGGDPTPPNFEIPKYWDPIYLAKYRKFVAALAVKYDGDPRVEFIQIGVGKFGETQPCDDYDDSYVINALVADPSFTPGYPNSAYTWPYIVNATTDIYADNFTHTTLFLPSAPTFGGDTCGRRTWNDHAISRGVGLFPAGMYAIQETIDYRPKTNWDGCGMYDRILGHAEDYEAGTATESWVAVAHEGYHYMSPTTIEFYWAVLAALRRHVDYVTLERDIFFWDDDGNSSTPMVPRPDWLDYVTTTKWGNQYMGKHMADTPSIWVALRESGYADNFYPQKGNHSFWLYQDDNIVQGKTVVTTWRAKSAMVHSWDYTAYGDAAVRSTIETSNATLSLNPSKEGWIARRTDYRSGNPYMWFKVDDRYAVNGPGEVTIKVTYFDHGTDSWKLTYDGSSNPYTDAGVINKTNSNTWKTATFTFSNGYFGNRQSSAADFRIDSMGDGDEYIHMVDFSTDGGGITPTPTATTDPGITPTVTATRTNTPLVSPTPAVVDLSSSKDTYIDTWFPDTNYGADQRIGVGRSTGVYRGLLQFNTSTIPTNATVTRATLRLYLDYYDQLVDLTPTVSVYKMLQIWEEMQATWNQRTTGITWASPGASSGSDRAQSPSASTVVSTPNTWYEWDVTALVQDWAWYPTTNKGMMVIADAPTNRWLRFHSANMGTNQPLLHVEYTTGSVPPTLTVTPTASGTPSTTPPANIVTIRSSTKTKDTYINVGAPSTNYEGQGIRITGSGWKRGLINFDISEIPENTEIVSATLQLTAGTYNDGATDRSLDVGAYLLHRRWVANQATWAASLSGEAWAVPGANGIPTDRDGVPSDVRRVQAISTGTLPYQRAVYTWTVTSIVQAWANDRANQAGMILFSEQVTSRDIGFNDSAFLGEAGIDQHPALVVEWRYLPADTPTPTPTVTATHDPGLGVVQGTVYNDLNKNGSREVGELGVMGAAVELWRGGVKQSTINTPGSGDYTFNNLPAGSYTIKLKPPTGYAATGATSQDVVLTSTETLTVNFGVAQAAGVYLPVVLKNR